MSKSCKYDTAQESNEAKVLLFHHRRHRPHYVILAQMMNELKMEILGVWQTHLLITFGERVSCQRDWCIIYEWHSLLFTGVQWKTRCSYFYRFDWIFLNLKSYINTVINALLVLIKQRFPHCKLVSFVVASCMAFGRHSVSTRANVDMKRGCV